jgi:four helix bundle protein
MSYQKLLVWKESYRLAKAIYRLTGQFPPHERFGIVSQMRRAAVSIPSNIAEGYRRRHAKEIVHFCQIAYGSASELEVQLSLSKDFGFAAGDSFGESEQALQSTLRLLNLFSRSISNKSTEAWPH